MIQRVCVFSQITHVMMSKNKNRKSNKTGFCVLPSLQCSPVQPRPQVQLPAAASHTPPFLQLQRWRQSAPNQNGGQPERRTHTRKLVWNIDQISSSGCHTVMILIFTSSSAVCFLEAVCCVVINSKEAVHQCCAGRKAAYTTRHARLHNPSHWAQSVSHHWKSAKGL